MADDAIGLINANVTQENQRIATDESTVTSNEFGGGCSFGDFSTYDSCLLSEEQTADNAREDELAADGAVDEDYVQYASAALTYETALSAFIGQLVALTWPSKFETAVVAVAESARALRTDVVDETAFNSSSLSTVVSAIQAQTGTDVGTFNDDLSVLTAELAKDYPQVHAVT